MGIITDKELETARRCVQLATRFGSDQARISLSKSVQNSICTLDGKVDRILSSTDRSLLIQIFASGSYGTFSTNMLEDSQLEDFIRRAVGTTSILAHDPCYGLPPAALKASGVTDGNEMGLVDPEFFDIPGPRKIELALECTGSEALSEEGEYSDSFDDNYIIDSDGFEGRSSETAFNFSSSVTLLGPDESKYTGYWWDSATFWKNFKPCGISRTAVDAAREKFNPRALRSGKYNVVVDRSCSSRLLRPVIGALSGYSIYQHNSFMEGKLGKEVFSRHLTVTDVPAVKGMGGSRLFDSEGIALKDAVIIGEGVLEQYFLNTYISRKLDMAPTTEAVTRAVLKPWICNSAENEVNLKDLMKCCNDGICITGFNGGNCNPSTGDFSFGIEGFLFKGGEKVHPFSEALMTGNMIRLWRNLLGAGSDARECQLWKVPSLAFCDIDINA